MTDTRFICAKKKYKVGDMKVIYNTELNGWQIVHTPNQFTKQELWNKPVNSKTYDTWASAMHDLDKWAE